MVLRSAPRPLGGAGSGREGTRHVGDSNAMRMRHVGFCRLDGGMTEAARADNIARFCGDRDNTVFLISTMAGGTGLNLPAASRVVLVKPNTFPSVYLQCVCVCVRVP